MSKRKTVLEKKWILLCVFGVLFVWAYLKNGEVEEAPRQEEVMLKTKQAEIISFGEWHPEEYREILATVESDQEVKISAEVMGVIDRVFVDIGDTVRKNQVLASYKKSSDPTQINFDNALRNLNTTKDNADNLVRQAETNLDTLAQENKQSRLRDVQTKRQAFEKLKTQAKNTEVLISNYLKWIDRLMGASNDYRYETVSERAGIGAQDKIGKQDVKNMIENLVYDKTDRLKALIREPEDSEVFEFADIRLIFLRNTKDLAVLFDDLIHRTLVTYSLTETQLQSLKSQSSVFLDRLNAEILTLETTLEATRGEVRRYNLSLISSANRIENAKMNLELVRSNAQSQISGAQNQYLLAESSQNDLEIRAPFYGKIVQKSVSSGEQVTAGRNIFSLLSDTGSLRVVAFLAPEELQKIQGKEYSEILLENGTIIKSSHSSSSIRLDPTTQKMRVEFHISKQEGIHVGAMVKVIIPVNGTKRNLLPLSAVSFEPTGKEVLVVNSEGITERRKLQLGNTISNSVEVVSGLEVGDRVVRYRNRVFSGERVEE